MNEEKYLQFVELFKKTNLTLEKQKQQVQDLWKIVKNDQPLYEKKETLIN